MPLIRPSMLNIAFYHETRRPRAFFGDLQELEIFTDVGIQAHYFKILNRLSRTNLIMENHSLVSTPYSASLVLKGPCRTIVIFLHFGVVRQNVPVDLISHTTSTFYLTLINFGIAPLSFYIFRLVFPLLMW